jgi:hypothetical protein
MSVTSFIKPIQNRKGIFYTFQSARDDITLTFNHDNKKFRFSKYVLLRLPGMGVPNDIENKIQFLAVGESAIQEGIDSVDYNKNLAESFQNYCLNFESVLLSQSTYNRNIRRTVSERVFWKWLKETGAIRFRESNSLEGDNTQLGSESRFVEEDEYTEGSPIVKKYDRVIKQVGDINMVNSVKNKNAYTEIYVHIPTDSGTTPHVLFDSISDNNYSEDSLYLNQPESALDIEYLSGRHYNDTHPFGLSIKALYDLDDGNITTEYSNNITTPSYVTGNWFNGNTLNAYYTEPNFGTANNQIFKKSFGLPVSEVEYIRNTLDGISLDFNLDNYKLINENQNINSFNEFNQYIASLDFEYNAILIYYDLFDADSPDTVTTNLYGIQFLNQAEVSGLEFEIPYITKYKPDVLSKVNGNSFAHRINIKFDSSIENVGAEKSINDYNTLSMDLFLDALNAMVTLTEQYDSNISYIQDVKAEVDQLKQLLVTETTQNEIMLRLTSIEQSLNTNQALFDNSNSVMGLINDLFDKYNDILNNNTSIDVSYNLDEAVLNSLITTNQQYSLNNDPIGDIINNNVLTLTAGSNYYRHENSLVLVTELTDDFDIYIDDSNVSWKNGQSFDLVFHDPIDVGTYNIKIWTDQKNTLNNGSYGVSIGILDSTDFEPSLNKPIFRITCINSKTLTFIIDKIR